MNKNYVNKRSNDRLIKNTLIWPVLAFEKSFDLFHSLQVTRNISPISVYVVNFISSLSNASPMLPEFGDWKIPEARELDQVFSLSLRGSEAAEEGKTEDLI